MKPPALRTFALAVFGLRIAYGTAMIAAPERIGRPWLGAGADTTPTQVAVRGIGGREVAIHGLAVAAALREAPLRPWLLGSIAGDLTDLCSTFAGRKGLPGGAVRTTAVAAGGSAAMSAALWALAGD
jgi:hypothetical protein